LRDGVSPGAKDAGQSSHLMIWDFVPACSPEFLGPATNC